MFVKPITSGTVIEPIKSLFEKDVQKEGNEIINGTSNFAGTLAKAINDIKGMEDLSEQYSYEVAMGNTDNLEAMMINTAKLNTTVQLATTITSRAVSAYKEILQMQV